GTPFTEKVQLTKDAIDVGLTHAQGHLDFVSSIPRQSDPRTAAALHDCVKLFGDAIHSFRNALKTLNQLSSPGSPYFREQMLNANLDLGAAGTNAETCKECFEFARDGRLKTEVSKRVEDISRDTNNALTLLEKIGEGAAP
ncbi:hypothetical protein C1H46_021004, partial [Malus baccata]